MIFYGNHFSPFSRKVMMVLEHKKLTFEYVDGLDQRNHQALKAINNRLGISIDSLRFPKLERWLQQLRGLPLFKHDLARTREYLGAIDAQNIERKKIFWRGDRIEWLLAKGFEQWLFGEIRAGRTVFPELGAE